MATVAEVQDELGHAGLSPRIIRSEDAATLRQNYVLGGASNPGRARWVVTTIADSAADQKTALLAGLA